MFEKNNNNNKMAERFAKVNEQEMRELLSSIRATIVILACVI